MQSTPSGPAEEETALLHKRKSQHLVFLAIRVQDYSHPHGATALVILRKYLLILFVSLAKLGMLIKNAIFIKCTPIGQHEA